jgi:hypothetical protein
MMSSLHEVRRRAAMSEVTANSSVPEPQAEQTAASSETQRAYPKIQTVILFAIVAIVFTALWLGAYSWINTAIWSNSFVTSHRWTIPVGVLFFSLLVGLGVKYLRAPTVIDGGALAAMKGGAMRRLITRLFRVRCSPRFARCSPGPVLGLKEPWVLSSRISTPGWGRN